MTATATITVSNLYPPDSGRGPSRIRDTKGRYWKAWPDRIEQYGLDAKGATFLVTYQTETWKGKESHTIISAVPAGSQTSEPQGSAGPSVIGSAKDEIIFVEALIKEWMNKIPVGDMAAVHHAVKVLRAVYQAHWGISPQAGAKKPVARPSLKDELNDELPDFGSGEPTSLEDTLDGQ